MIRKYIASVLFTCVFCITVLSQDGKIQKEKGIRVVEDKSTVSIGLDCKDKKKIKLRLYNNTNWAIAVPTFSYYFDPKKLKKVKLNNGTSVFAMPSDKEISSLYYFVEKEVTLDGKKVLILETYATDSLNVSWIAPNDSIFFSIPIEHLKNEWELYVKFNYEWELPIKGTFLSNEPQHRLYFRWAKDEESQNCS